MDRLLTSHIVTNGSAANGANNFNFAGHLVYSQGSTETTVTSGITITTVEEAVNEC